MRRLDRSFVRSVLLPANLIIAALVIFAVLAFSVEGDLRLVSREIDPDLRRPPAGEAGAADPSGRGTLTVKVTGARDAGGKIQVLVLDGGPPADAAHVVAQKWVPASPQGSTAVFESLPYGSYSVLAHPDPNGNASPEARQPGGPPVEAVGDPGSAGAATGAPAREDARVVLDREALEIEIPLRSY